MRVVSDGGGTRAVALEPIVERDAVVALHEGMACLFAKVGRELVRFATINGLPGFVTREADGIIQTTALEVEDGRVIAIYIVRNPDKLGHVEGTTRMSQ